MGNDQGKAQNKKDKVRRKETDQPTNKRTVGFNTKREEQRNPKGMNPRGLALENNPREEGGIGLVKSKTVYRPRRKAQLPVIKPRIRRKRNRNRRSSISWEICLWEGFRWSS